MSQDNDMNQSPRYDTPREWPSSTKAVGHVASLYQHLVPSNATYQHLVPNNATSHDNLPFFSFSFLIYNNIIRHNSNFITFNSNSHSTLTQQ